MFITRNFNKLKHYQYYFCKEKPKYPMQIPNDLDSRPPPTQMVIDHKSIQKKLRRMKISKDIATNVSLQDKSSYHNPKFNPKNRGIFDFSDPSLGLKQGLQIQSVSELFVSINGLLYPGCVMLFNTQVFLMNMETPQDMKAHSLDFLDVVSPQPKYIIIGTGSQHVDVPESVYQRFRSRGINVDVLRTFEAVSTYNYCSNDDIDVCGIIFPST